MSADFESLARDYLYRRDNIINPTLDGIRTLLSQLGDPHLRLSAIQITGTNGKSSTTWMTEALLTAQGYKTASFTSPHLVSFTERLRLGGVDVDEARLARHVARVGVVVDRLESTESMTFSGFEIMTAACMDLLAEADIDVVVLEVGMGGRWDATTLVPARVAAITHVALDHTEILGADKAAIASEKAYVYRSGRICLTAETDPEVLRILSDRVAELSTESAQTELQVVDGLPGHLRSLDAYDLPFPGAHQWLNLALAVALAETYSGSRLAPDSVVTAMNTLRLPGRLETVAGSPLVVLDGAHNPDAAARLAEWLAEWKSPGTALSDDKGPIVLLLGILSDKDAAGIVTAVSGVADCVVATRASSPRALSAELVSSLAAGAVSCVRTEPDIDLALAMARELAGPDGMVCVTGSLYVVGAVKALMGRQSQPLDRSE